jgi:UDP-N-acetylmuramoyl-L-alanyl-D-glutamate--2,6-diaminopimelate ligase
MNSEKLINVLNECEDIQWNLESSSSQTLVFYYTRDDSSESEKKFKERICDKKYFKIITNLEVEYECVEVVKNEVLLELMKQACDHFYPLPSIKSIAITGTNGKTTTVDMIRQLLNNRNKNVLTIGTMGVFFNNDKVDDFNLTSPHYIDLRKTISKYLKDDDYLAIESSSHAIDQKRQYGLVFDSIGFTSFSQDHLDYHNTIEEYFNTKLKLREQCQNDFVVSGLATSLKEKLKSFKSYRFKEEINNMYLNISYNRINLDVALGCLDNLGFKFSIDEVEKIKETAGRFNIIKNEDQIFIVDFAHTPDSLENILKAIKNNFDKKIACIFGCGGNRDKTKRPIMGAIVEKNADVAIITTDNPRFEEPSEIIKDIEKGFNGNDFVSIVDRYDAIKYAFENLKDHVILIAGKGHEEYIDQNGKKSFFSDIKTVNELIQC